MKLQLSKKQKIKISETIDALYNSFENSDDTLRFSDFTKLLSPLIDAIWENNEIAEIITKVELYIFLYDKLFTREEKDNLEIKSLAFERNEAKALIILFLSNLPFNYTIFLQSQIILPEYKSTLEISPEFKIQKFTKEEILKLADVPNEPQNKISRALIGSPPIVLEENDNFFFCIETSGYASPYTPNSSAVHMGTSHLKHYIYLGIIYGLYKRNIINRYSKSTYNAFCFFRNKDTGKHFSYEFPISGSVSKLLSNIEISEDATASRTLLSLNDSEYQNFLNRHGEINKFFALDRNDEQIKRIFIALDWGIESLINEDEQSSFIQTCIALEALLGEDFNQENKTLRVTTETLADRCSYLLCKNSQDRTEMRTKFRAIYKIRNNIVHGKTDILRKSISEKLLDTEFLLQRIIKKEINSLVSDNTYPF